MPKYINAAECAEIISEKFNISLDDLVDVFAEIPTADVEEVVRCKDCEYYKQSFSALFPQEVAYICDNPYGLKKNPDKKDFCSHGERTTERG